MSIIRKQFRYSFHSVVLYLIGINALVYLAQRMFNLTPYIAMIPGMVLRGWVWQLVTYMFAHDPRNWSHILFNMLGLFMFGWQVEKRMGSREFLLYYLVTGALAGLASFALYYFTGTRAVLLGASGALFAVELAFAAFYPDALIYIWGIIPLRAPVMVLGYTAMELFFSLTGKGRGVAHFTHLSGFAMGWLYFVIRFRINPWKAFRRRY
jgi:membrane associated rhomboid family serine protease